LLQNTLLSEERGCLGLGQFMLIAAHQAAHPTQVLAFEVEVDRVVGGAVLKVVVLVRRNYFLVELGRMAEAVGGSFPHLAQSHFFFELFIWCKVTGEVE